MDQALTLLGVSVDVRSDRGAVRLLNDISFSVPRRSMTALIGESGSGKTTLALAITRLFTHPERTQLTGSVMLGDQALAHMEDGALRGVRRSIRYVLQEPATAFNPLMKIRPQLNDAAGRVLSTDEAAEMLRRVGLTAETTLDAYPHELSVGMLQRISIAAAISTRPAVLIADEPTSALDAANRRTIMDLLRQLQHQLDLAILVITHDPLVVERYADRVIVLYAGRVIERAERDRFFRRPLHPYSRMLLQARRDRDVLQAAAADVPVRLEALPSGCAYAPRCPYATDACRLQEPLLEQTQSDDWIRCLNWTSIT